MWLHACLWHIWPVNEAQPPVWKWSGKKAKYDGADVLEQQDILKHACRLCVHLVKSNYPDKDKDTSTIIMTFKHAQLVIQAGAS